MLVRGRSTLLTCHPQCSKDLTYREKKNHAVRGRLKSREKREWRKVESNSY